MAGFSTRALRGRPVTAEEAKATVHRLINSHFHNEDRARCSIPARADDDDIVAADWVEESAERIAALERKLDAAQAENDLCPFKPERESLRVENAELKRKLAALDWTPISKENLPKAGDEVGQWVEDFEDHGFAVNRIAGLVALTKEQQILELEHGGWTHFRPINPPEHPAPEKGN